LFISWPHFDTPGKILSLNEEWVNIDYFFHPDRYGHTFQILDAEEGSGEKKVIERTEAVRHILAIMKKLGVRWQRTPKQLPGWRDSL
jgi:hypothetical protein